MAPKARPHSQHLPLVDSFLRSLRADGRRPRTIEHYTGAALRFLTWCDDQGRDPFKVRASDVREFNLYLQDEGLAPASVNNYFRGVRAFYDWLVDEQEITVSPFGRPRARTLEAPQADTPEKDVVSRADMTKLIKKLEREKRWRDAAVLTILYDSGVRASELAGAKVDHLADELDDKGVPTGAGWLTIDAMTAKGKRTRVVRFSPTVMRYLDRYWRLDGKRGGRKEPAYLVNGIRGHMTRSGVYQLIRDLFIEIGVTAKIGAHDLRHTAASHMAEDGVIQESEALRLFGWRSSSMWRLYTEQAQQKAALRAHATASPMERLRDK